jgi:hypothetical protein
MNLNLKWDPTPANAAKFAADIVVVAREVSGVPLDYSPNSLAVVDGIIADFAREGCRVEDIRETLFGFGCYVGEVFVRGGQGKWRAPKSETEKTLFGFPLVVELAPENVCNPIGKVFKRLELGESENLRYFHTVFSRSEVSKKIPWWRRIFGRQ